MKKTVSLTLLFAFLSAGLQYLTISNDPGVYFSAGNQSYSNTLRMEQVFSPNDVVVFIVEPTSGEVFQQKTLSVIDQLTRDLWKQDFVQRVDSLTSFNQSLVNDDGLLTQPLFDRDKKYTAVQLEKLKYYAVQHPRIRRLLVDENASVALLTATLNIEKGSEQLQASADWAYELEKYYQEQYPFLRIHVAGNAIFADFFKRITEKEFVERVPFILFVIFLVAALLLRSFPYATLLTAVILLCISSTIGLMGWLAVPLTPVAAFIAVAIITIVIANGMHIFSSYRHALVKYPPSDSIKIATSSNFQPVLITTVTTMVGFLCLLTSDSPPYQMMGVFIAVGALFSFIAVMYWMPAVVVLLPGEHHPSPSNGFSRKWLRVWMHNGRPILVVLVAISVLFVIQLSILRFNESVLDNFSGIDSVNTTASILDTKMAGTHRIDIEVDAGNINSPSAMKMLSLFRQWALQQPRVASVSAIDQVVSELNLLLNGQQVVPSSPGSIPGDASFLAQILLMYELSLPFGMGVEDLVSFDRTKARVRVTLHSTDSQTLIDFSDRAHQWFSQQAPDVHVTVAGMDLAFATLNKQNAQSIMLGTLLAFLVIAVLMCLVSRSVLYGMLSLLPNLFPALCSYAIWASIDGQISLATSIVACITLGVVVDDTIHLLFHYRRFLAQGMAPEEAAIATLNYCGRALVATTVVLCIAFGMLAGSPFKPNADLGLLTSMTLAIALLADLFLLMPVLVWLEKYRHAGLSNEGDTLPSSTAGLETGQTDAHIEKS